ncbi:MAG: hypothetical protein ACP5XB_28130 [Isosphaeraceae bacterium]
MTAEKALVWAGKFFLAGSGFIVGLMLGGAIAAAAGFPPLPAPRGNGTHIVSIVSSIGILMALGLFPIAGGLAHGFTTRWLVLTWFSWIAFSVNTVLEARIFTNWQTGWLHTLTSQGVMCLIGCAVLAALAQPADEVRHRSFARQIRSFRADRSIVAWAIRLVLAWLAFPFIYFGIGMLVAPIVVPYYQQDNVLGLQIPGFDVLIPVLLTRSLLFVVASLPILIAWQRDRLDLFWALGFALFMMVGGVGLIPPSRMPMVLRVTHGLEILADSFAHAAALVLLLVAVWQGEAPDRFSTACPTGSPAPLGSA